MVIFLIPRFMRVYSFLEAVFGRIIYFAFFDGKNDNPVSLWTLAKCNQGEFK